MCVGELHGVLGHWGKGWYMVLFDVSLLNVVQCFEQTEVPTYTGTYYAHISWMGTPLNQYHHSHTRHD